MNAVSLALVRSHFPRCASRSPPAPPWSVLVELAVADERVPRRARAEAALAAAIEPADRRHRGRGQHRAQARALWQLREAIPLAQGVEGPNIKHDIAVPLSALADFVAAADAALRGASSRRAPRHLRPPGRRQPALQPAGARRATTPPAFSPRTSRRQRVVYDVVDALRRHVLGRARHRRAQARRAGGAQVGGGAGDDAGDQGGARPARAAQPGRDAAAIGTRDGLDLGRRAARHATERAEAPSARPRPSANARDQRHANPA